MSRGEQIHGPEEKMIRIYVKCHTLDGSRLQHYLGYKYDINWHANLKDIKIFTKTSTW